MVDTDSQLITAVDVLPGNAPDDLGTLELVEQIAEESWPAADRRSTPARAVVIPPRPWLNSQLWY